MKNLNEYAETFGNDLKVILVGNASTGKTSIVDRYIKNIFINKKEATIAPNSLSKLIRKNNVIYRLHIWDIPGQDKSPALTSIFCKDSHGIIFCCDALVEQSRNDILTWIKSIKEFIDISDLPMIIMENKCDLLGDENDYDKGIEELKSFSDNNNFLGAFRTSALNGYNVENAINFLVDDIINKIENNKSNNTPNTSIKLNETKEEQKSKRCC
jgi:small GTP-binding protein